MRAGFDNKSRQDLYLALDNNMGLSTIHALRERIQGWNHTHTTPLEKSSSPLPPLTNQDKNSLSRTTLWLLNYRGLGCA